MSGFREMCCGDCGIAFQIPETFIAQRQAKGGTWYCPNGHPRVFRETDVQKLERENARMTQKLAQKDDELREAWAGHHDALEGWRRQGRVTAAYKGNATKLRKRAAGGACPCCNRNFVKLSQHMKTKHPDYVEKPDFQVVEGGKAA